MHIPLQITIRDMSHSEALDARIRDKVTGLERFDPNITSCRVTVAESHKHHQQGRQFEVGIDVRMAGHEQIVASRHHEDIYVALRDAFDATTRQVEDAVRKKRDAVKAHK